MHQSNKLTPNAGDIGIILAVGGLFYLLSRQPTAVIIGAIRADPCNGLTGSLLINCRKAHPEYRGITPATPKPKKTGITPARRPPIAKKQLVIPKPNPTTTNRNLSPEDREKKNNEILNLFKPKDPNWKNSDWSKKCEVMASEIAKYLRQRKEPNKELIMRKWRKFGYTDRDYDCGKIRAERRVAEKSKTMPEDLNDWERYRYGKQESDLWGLEKTDKPANQNPNPLDKLVNDIGNFLSEAWRNLTSGKTAIGGQPTILTGSPSAPVVRPTITPIA